MHVKTGHSSSSSPKRWILRPGRVFQLLNP